MSDNTNVSAQEFYELLITDGIRESSGNVKFTLNNVDIYIKELNAIGHLLEEWILGWATIKKIKISRNPRSQEFPDYYLNGIENPTEGLLEIKSFNYHAQPSFDVADFFEYVDFLEYNPYKLYADYLVIGYEMSNDDSSVIIKDIWIKKIWELVGYSAKNHITSQVRTSKEVRRPLKIRPTSFHKNGRCFNSAEDFLENLQNLLNENDITAGKYEDWYEKVNQAHYSFYNENIK